MNNEAQKAIEVFEKPSKHIKCVHKCENGMEFLAYSQDLVAAFETAIMALKNLNKISERIGELEAKAIPRYKGGNFGDYEGTDYYIKKSDVLEILKAVLTQ